MVSTQAQLRKAGGSRVMDIPHNVATDSQLVARDDDIKWSRN